tara:strand:+ start:25 stop:480 length:456 start_codon:yes stop_codon:yes gene_type:complete
MTKYDLVKAHCDIPCKVYDPYIAQYSAISVVRLLDLISEIPDAVSKSDQAKLTRLVLQKEEHAHKVKLEVATIWGDYFKDPQIKAFPEIHELTHSIMMTASKCKQDILRENGLELIEKVNEFAKIFWASKNIETHTITSPNPPNLDLIVPK